ncbi:helix-turn-helix domain-containing protein [Bisgaard Taxon 45]
MGISQRLRAVMELQGLNIKAFAEQLEMPYRTLQNYLLNERDPSADVLVKVSELLNVDLNWLMRGKGEMFLSILSQKELTENEVALLNHYRMMSDDTKSAFDVSFKFLTEKSI